MHIFKDLINYITQWTLITKKEILEQKTNYTLLVNRIHEKNTEISILIKKIDDLNKENELEEYWNNKRTKVNKQWKARNGKMIDVRCFFQRDFTLPTFKGTDDEIATQILSYGIRNLTYKSELKEFWKYSYETLSNKEGDCEDGAILLANMMWNSGIPYWKIRLNMGSVKGGYHAWLTYLKEEDNTWYVCDWCYWPNESDGLNLKWKDAENYYTTDASWNPKYSFGGLQK